MNNLQKLGGISALTGAALYILGIVYFVLIVDYTVTTDPLQKMLLLIENKLSLYAVSLLIWWSNFWTGSNYMVCVVGSFNVNDKTTVKTD